MFMLPLGWGLGADVSMSAVFLNNILPVTLGNILGGCFMGAFYHTPPRRCLLTLVRNSCPCLFNCIRQDRKADCQAFESPDQELHERERAHVHLEGFIEHRGHVDEQTWLDGGAPHATFVLSTVVQFSLSSTLLWTVTAMLCPSAFHILL